MPPGAWMTHPPKTSTWWQLLPNNRRKRRTRERLHCSFLAVHFFNECLLPIIIFLSRFLHTTYNIQQQPPFGGKQQAISTLATLELYSKYTIISTMRASLITLSCLLLLLVEGVSGRSRRSFGAKSSRAPWGSPYLDLSPAVEEDLSKDLREYKEDKTKKAKQVKRCEFAVVRLAGF